MQIYYSVFKVHCQEVFVMDIFCERFKELKQSKNFTYPKLAELLSLNPRTVKGYAAGTIKPDYFKLIALADYFDVSLDYLVGRSDDPKRH